MILSRPKKYFLLFIVMTEEQFLVPQRTFQFLKEPFFVRRTLKNKSKEPLFTLKNFEGMESSKDVKYVNKEPSFLREYI